jgi:hypothetical protein
MKAVNGIFNKSVTSSDSRRLQPGRGLSLGITILALCSALALPGIAQAKKPVQEPAGCVMFPPTIYTGFPFTVKVVRDPAYPGVWSQPTVEVTAVFTKADKSEITQTYSETVQRYGVTYINATLTAPSNLSCDQNGVCTDVGIESLASISAIVKEPLNKGNKYRETVCTPLDATVNISN